MSNPRPRVVAVGHIPAILDANKAYFESIGYSVPHLFITPQAVVEYLVSPPAGEEPVQAVVIGGGFPNGATDITQGVEKAGKRVEVKLLSIPPDTLEKFGIEGLKKYAKEMLQREVGPGVL